jgi:hypothetical protein
MARLPKHERDRLQGHSVAEEFHISQEARYQAPTLEQRYWSNPNSQRGEIARCLYESAGIKAEVIYSEGN